MWKDHQVKVLQMHVFNFYVLSDLIIRLKEWHKVDLYEYDTNTESLIFILKNKNAQNFK